MQAIILAAGMGKRLKKYTENNTKCMIKVNGTTLIERLLYQLDSFNLDRVIIVTGYEGRKLVDYIDTLDVKTKIIFVNNPIYESTNNIYSLSLAKRYMIEDDTLIFESDIIFENKVLSEIIEDPRDSLALVDEYRSWMDGTCLKLDEHDRIVDFVSGKRFDYKDIDGWYKTVNVYKFSKRFAEKQYIPFLEAYLRALGVNEYYEQVLKVITMLDNAEIEGKRLHGEKWYEIDNEQDLDIAEVLFAEEDDAALKRYEERYGGYWRFPKLLDFCYLVNPYFPPQKMLDEIKASFDMLITQYPSGEKVNSLLAAMNFGVNKECIVVGNGASELIKALVEKVKGKIGIIRPTFEEYPNRCNEEQLVVYNLYNSDFAYSADDIISFFGDKDIAVLILITPDNPSGNYINKDGIDKIIKWTKIEGIKLMLDESFIDFAEEEITYINQELLDDNKHLYVVKSISKSYGVPGLRLGVLVSGNTEDIDMIKSELSIWNINSYAEFYMQILEKYKNYYAEALKRFKEERKRFYNQLSEIDYLRVICSQANYFLIEIIDKYDACTLARILLVKYGIIIKDLSAKINNRYIRVAIRNQEDNDKLINAFRGI